MVSSFLNKMIVSWNNSLFVSADIFVVSVDKGITKNVFNVKKNYSLVLWSLKVEY